MTIRSVNMHSSFLAPEKGKEKLRSVSAAAKNWHKKMQTIFKPDFSNFIDPGTARNRKAIRETLELMSHVLLSCPLTGTDGAPGKRSFFAHPMYFGKKNAVLLRELGKCLSPASFNPIRIKQLLKDRYEIYKLEISPSSGLLGFSYDAYGYFNDITGLVFSCYKGSGNRIKIIAQAKVPLAKLDDDFTLSLDFFSYNVNYHDIDRYEWGF
jgi:hypothetical protein